MKFILKSLLLIGALCLIPGMDVGELQGQAAGQAAPGPSLRIDISGQDEPQDVSIAIQLVVAMTLLTLSPSIIMMMTSFTRIVIVLSFVRMAMGVQQAPSNQIVVGLALFLTVFIMAPTWDLIYADAVVPYIEEEATSGQSLQVATEHMKTFMLKQTDEKDVDFMLGLSKLGPMTVDQLPLSVVVPSFVLSELRTAFQMVPIMRPSKPIYSTQPTGHSAPIMEKMLILMESLMKVKTRMETALLLDSFYLHRQRHLL